MRQCVQKALLGFAAWLFLFSWSAQAQSSGLAANPNSISFGNVTVGTVTPPVAVTLTNINPAMTFTIVNIFSTSGPFAISGPSLPVTLAPGQSLTVNVTFAPSAPQSQSGSFGFTTYYGWKISVPLSGTGVPAFLNPNSGGAIAPSVLSVAPAGLNFGNPGAGGTAAVTASLTDSGNSTITIASVNLSGPGISLAGIYPGMVLSPGQTILLAASLDSAPDSAANGTITVNSDALNYSLIIPWTIAPGSASSAAPWVELSWNPSSSDGVIGYNVYRGPVSGGPYFPLTAAPVAGTSYHDTSVTSSQTFYYVVTSVGAGNVEGAASAEVSATIP
jgi:hypothetical protein